MDQINNTIKELKKKYEDNDMCGRYIYETKLKIPDNFVGKFVELSDNNIHDPLFDKTKSRKHIYNDKYFENIIKNNNVKFYDCDHKDTSTYFLPLGYNKRYFYTCGVSYVFGEYEIIAIIEE